jgi:hypothetical protein
MPRRFVRFAKLGSNLAVLLMASDGGLWLSNAGSITEILPVAEIPSSSVLDAAIQVSSSGSWILSYRYLLSDSIGVKAWGAIKTSSTAYGPWPMYAQTQGGCTNGALALRRLLGYRDSDLGDPLSAAQDPESCRLNLTYIGTSSTTPASGEMSLNVGQTMLYIGAPDYALEGLIAGDNISWLDLSGNRRVFTYNSHTYSSGVFAISVTYVGIVTGATNTENFIILVANQSSGEVRSITRQYSTAGLTLTRSSAGLLLGLSSLLPATTISGFNNDNRTSSLGYRAIRDESDLHGIQEIAEGTFEHVAANGDSTELAAIDYASFGDGYELCRYDHPRAYIARPPASYSDGLNTADIASLAVDLSGDTIAISGTATAQFLLPADYVSGGWSIVKFYLAGPLATA